MALTLDTNASVKMILFTNNDNEGGWSGTDGPDDYGVAIQGTNSESWQVSKNSTETGTLTKTAVDMSNVGNHFNFWMMSNLTQYLTSIKVRLQSSSGNYREYTIATSTLQYVTGEFHSFALDVSGGVETGTFNSASVSSIVIIVDNSSSGNIRSVINNWIDAMYFGRGLTFNGSSSASKMIAEAAAIDELYTNKFGVMTRLNEQIFSQGDIIFYDDGSTNVQSSNGENLIFTKKINATNTYRFILQGADNTVTFTNTNISATDTARFGFDSSGTIGSFTMVGGTLKKASSILFKAGQTITGVNFTESGYVDTNGATLSGCSFISTIEDTTGALLVNSGTEAAACSDLQFTDYSSNGYYAVYVAAGVTSFTMDNWVFDDPDNTIDIAVHWLGTSGTLTISAVNGTNLVTAGCSAETGGAVTVVNNVSTNLIGMKDNTEVRVYTKGTTTELAGIENATTGSADDRSFSFSLTAGANIDIRIYNVAYKPADILDYTVGTVAAILPIQQVYDPNYSNP